MPKINMTLTKQFLEDRYVCQDGFDWFVSQEETNVIKVLRKLDKENHIAWANWLIVRKMTKKQCISYAIFSAEQVIDIYEKKYPDDNHPRQAIDAAKKYLDHPSKENAAAAEAGAAYAANAGYAAAVDAGYSAAAAAHAATHAGYAYATYADAAVDAATYAAAAYAYAAGDKKKMQRKILNYGIGLIEGGIHGVNERFFND